MVFSGGNTIRVCPNPYAILDECFYRLLGPGEGVGARGDGGGGKVAAGSPGSAGTEGMRQRDALLHPLTPHPEDGGESPRRRRHFVLYFSSLQGRR